MDILCAISYFLTLVAPLSPPPVPHLPPPTPDPLSPNTILLLPHQIFITTVLIFSILYHWNLKPYNN